MTPEGEWTATHHSTCAFHGPVLLICGPTCPENRRVTALEAENRDLHTKLEEVGRERDALLYDVRQLTRAGVPYDHERVIIRRLHEVLEGNPTRFKTTAEYDLEARLQAAERRAEAAEQEWREWEEAAATWRQAAREQSDRAEKAERRAESAERYKALAGWLREALKHRDEAGRFTGGDAATDALEFADRYDALKDGKA